MKMVFVTLMGMIVISNSAYSMGGDKPGPNGGFVKMPGTYHVELVPKKDKVLVYLLDLSLKNPISQDSSVTLKLINKETKELGCKVENKYFICNISSAEFAQYSEVNVESIRNKIKGKVAVYKIPLKFD
ncbi:MAG: hypothetical protein H7336_03170 [Bacteriovorax sp.]|nr:hypothetical protein [Bacteriovorax sp.]